MSVFLKALRGNNTERAPIWLMRQSGRYLPEYLQLKQGMPFMQFIKSKERMLEATLLPLRRFPLDAAILFSDILVVPEAMGKEVVFVAGKGPILKEPIQTEEQVYAIANTSCVEKLTFVRDTIRLLKKELSVPLIGFSGAPFTLASYMVKTQFAKGALQAKEWIKKSPQAFKRLLDVLTEQVIAYAKLQIKEGIDCFQLFDTWANVLDDSELYPFSASYLETICQALKPYQVPILIYSKSASRNYVTLAKTGCQGISFDENGRLDLIRRQLPAPFILQGNFAPSLLYEENAYIEKTVREGLESMRADPAYIINLGHGIAPDMKVEKVQLFVESCLKELSLSA